ncbi:MAG: CCA tRNA nucleotidyltransferase [Kiritimatiellae bacterium]|nr:CCA tRNA nucleotidyltransferase [Kiritimatiellia bacterium]
MSIQIPDSDEALGACRVAERLHQNGFTALWAGGCVRDLLLNRPPIDYDIATNAHPETVLKLFKGSLATGKSFGVVRVPIDEHWFEVATFRKDHDYQDGRHPERVTFTDARHDAERRDFTINAMFFDPHTSEIIDYVQGMQDLKDKIIRCVGDPATRFAEDHLRLLRAPRFASTLNFEIEPLTAQAIRNDADNIERISVERIRTELTRTLCEADKAGDALMLLDSLGLLKPLLPEVKAMQGQEQPPEFHPEGDVFVHTVLMLNSMESPTLELTFSVLLHDIGKPPTAVLDGERWRFNGHASVGADMARKIMQRLRFSNDQIDTVDAAIRGHMRFMDVGRMRRATLRRWMGAPTFDLEMELHRLDCVGSHSKLDHYDFLCDAQKEFAAEPVLPEPWVNGKDIIRMGISNGPTIGKWKHRAYELQLDGQVANRDEALAQLRREMDVAADSSSLNEQENRKV